MFQTLFSRFHLILLKFGFFFLNMLAGFSKGNNSFVKNKLRIGALIISLSSLLSCHTTPKPTCYVTMLPDENDTIVKVQPIKPDSIRVTCYEMVAPDKNQEKNK